MKNDLKKTLTVINTLIIAAAICAILCWLVRETVLCWILLAILIVCGAAAIFIKFRFLRCPHCGAHLSAAHLTPKHNHCPGCGTALDI